MYKLSFSPWPLSVILLLIHRCCCPRHLSDDSFETLPSAAGVSGPPPSHIPGLYAPYYAGAFGPSAFGSAAVVVAPTLAPRAPRPPTTETPLHPAERTLLGQLLSAARSAKLPMSHLHSNDQPSGLHPYLSHTRILPVSCSLRVVGCDCVRLCDCATLGMLLSGLGT